MPCPSCDFSELEELPICPHCGQWRLSNPPALPAPSKRRSRLPYLLMSGLFILGLLVYLLFPLHEAPGVQEPPSASVPQEPESVQGTFSEGSPLFQPDCFSLENGVLSFDESQFQTYPILLVPSAIGGQNVTALSPGCFENLRNVTTIILPSTITEIGPRAFAGCQELRGICVPNGVTRIGDGAFQDCTRLEALYLPGGLESLDASVFSRCANLTYIFYNGPYAQWQALYSRFITPFTWVICWDGEYEQAGIQP